MITGIRGRSAARLAVGASSQALAAALAVAAFAVPAHAQDAPPVQEAEGEGQDIVVTGFAASLQTATAEKKNRDQVIESVSAEDIGKLPDASIAESIARLPGLTSQRLSGRANVVSIRGFAPDFSTTLLNGREQTSTGDNRAVEYDQYPSEVVSQVLVYKTAMPSIVGQGLSGTVDLRTIRPLEYGKRVFAVGGRGSYTDLGKLNSGSKEFGFRANAIYVDQFANDTIGVALSASYLNEPYQVQEFNSWGYPLVSAEDDRYGIRDTKGTPDTGDDTFSPRPGYEQEVGSAIIGGSKSYVTSTELKRLGLQGTLEWRAAPNFTITADGFYSDFKDDYIKRGIEIPLYWGGGTLQPDATVENGMIVGGTFTGVEGVVRNDGVERHAKLYSFGLNAAYEGDDGWNAMADISYSKTDRNELILEAYAGTGFGGGNGAQDTIDFTSTGTGAFFSHDLDYSDSGLIVLTDPLGWGGGPANPQVGYYNNRFVEDEIQQYRVEVEREMDSFLSSVKIGLNYTDHTKSLDPQESIVRLANGATEMSLPAQYRLDPTDQAYLGLGPILSFDPRELLAGGIYSLVSNTNNPDVVQKAFTVEENVMTAYFQTNLRAQLGGTELTGNIGVQAVGTDQKSSGRVIVGGLLQQATSGDDYWDILPSLNLSLRIPGDFVVRFAAARQMQRPRMDDMRQALSYGLNTSLGILEGNGGNPYLRPIRSNSVDLSLEKYFGTRGYIAAQFFYKDIKSFVYNQELPFDYTGLPVPTGPQPTTMIGRLTRPINGAGGSIKGVELAATLPLGELVGALSGFGVTGGLSYTDTSIRPTPTAPPENLPGYSKWVINGTAYFEKWGFSARGSVRYRSTFMGEFTGFGAGRERRRALDETIVDAQIGYEFQPGTFLQGVSLYLQGQNLTDEPFVTINPGERLQVIDHQVYGRRFLAGVNLKF